MNCLNCESAEYTITGRTGVKTLAGYSHLYRDEHCVRCGVSYREDVQPRPNGQRSEPKRYRIQFAEPNPKSKQGKAEKRLKDRQLYTAWLDVTDNLLASISQQFEDKYSSHAQHWLYCFANVLGILRSALELRIQDIDKWFRTNDT